MFIGRTDIEAETPILWLPDVKNWLIWKDPDAGKEWRWEEKGTTEDEMVGSITDSMDMSLSELWELVMDREARYAAVQEVTKSWTRLSDWTELIKSLTVSIVSASISHELMGPDVMILVFWMLNSKPTFSLSSFTFIKKAFYYGS